MGLLVMLLSLALVGCGPLPNGDAARPDIVLVSIDSLRADHLSTYGYARPTSPTIDRLAKEGLRFDRARSASPWTLPSHMTMLTGLWPTEHHVVEDDIALAPTVPLVTEALHDAGWATAGFVSTIYVSGTYGFSRGFDQYSDYGITERDNLTHPVRADRVVDDAVKWVAENGKGKPAFVFLHIYDAHYPYVPPQPFDEKFDRANKSILEARYRNYAYYKKHPLGKKRLAHQVAQYDESIAWVDSQLARLVDAWEDSGRPVRFIVTADHGEELGERGSWGHGHTLYREAVEIPLVVSGAGISPAVRTEQAGTVDIAATIAAMAGVPWGHGPGVDLRGDVPARPFYAETSRFDTSRLSILEGGKRLDLDFNAHARALYDVVKDPGEETDLGAGAEADRLERDLWSALPAQWAADGPVRSAGVLYADGRAVEPVKGEPVEGTQPKEEAVLAGPVRFGVYPADAMVENWRGMLDAPDKGPVRYEGARTAVPVSLSAQTKAQLEALGYVQGEAPEEPADEDGN